MERDASRQYLRVGTIRALFSLQSETRDARRRCGNTRRVHTSVAASVYAYVSRQRSPGGAGGQPERDVHVAGVCVARAARSN